MMIMIVFMLFFSSLSLAIIISTNRTEQQLTSFRGTEKLKQLIGDYAICDKFGVNKVLPRYENNAEWNHDFEIDRKWSMLSNTLALFSGMTNSRQLSHCERMSELLAAVSQDVERQGCLVPWIDAAGICEVLSRYRRLFIIGDSLMRHTMAGLRMLVYENFQWGAIMRTSLSDVESANAMERFRNCSCDGQFSEALYCRGAEISPSRGYCHQNDVANSFIVQHLSIKKEINFTTHLCDTKLTPSDGKPIFIALSHGIHYGFNASKIVEVFLKELYPKILIASKACPHQQVKPDDFRIVVFGGSASSAELAKKYQLQKMEKVVVFNEDIKNYVEAKEMMFKNVFFVDIFNLTLEAAENRTSDGLHLLSDLNAIRAMILVNVMDFALRNPI